MTGGQMELGFGVESNTSDGTATIEAQSIQRPQGAFKIISASQAELEVHEAMLQKLESSSGVRLWVDT